jgi:hypothetical protein
MAVSVFVPVASNTTGTATNNIYNATLGASANSTVITVGNDAIIRIACSGAINVKFSTATNLTTNPAIATDMYFPAGVYIYDVGHNNNAISIWSIAASTIITVSAVPRN